MGIPLGGSSQSYYSCEISYNESSQTVPVTISPVGNSTPVKPIDQLVYVVGSEVVWMSAAS